jgi:aspartate/methionine/tyrosine aminotransferase
MKQPAIASKAAVLKRTRSPVRQIMEFANPSYFRSIGLDPANVISFAGGWVNHDAPEEMRNVYEDLARDAERFHASGGYSPTLGFAECRAAVVEFERHIHGISSLDPGQVAIGANSTQMTHTLMSVLMDPGDTILLLDPSYCNFPMQLLTSIDCKIIRFPVVDTGSWLYAADERINAFSDFIRSNRPKVILLVAPDNPTSQIPSQRFLEAALEAAKDIGAFVLVDFAYKELVFQTPPDYFSWAPSDHFLSIHSNSKWCRGLGRRLGWIEAPSQVIEAFETLQGASALCPDSLHQMAFSDFVHISVKSGGLKRYIHDTAKLYARAAEATTSAIARHLGVPCFTPQGGLYTCFPVPTDGARFVEAALKATGTLLVPGWGFGHSLTNAVRASFGPMVKTPEKITLGMERLGRFLKNESPTFLSAGGPP